MMLNVFNRRCLRDIMGSSWKDHTTNEELSTKCRRWGTVAARRVLRLPTPRPASLIIDWTPERKTRRWGRLKRTWQDTFREDMQKMVVSGSDTHDKARSIASDRVR